MNKTVTLHDHILEWVYSYYNMLKQDRRPDIVINDGDYSYHGDDAVDMLCACANFLEVPTTDLLEDFPFDTYFLPEPSPFSPLLILWIIPLLVINSIFYIFKLIVRVLFNIHIQKNLFSYVEDDSLTAYQFANMMVLRVEKYHQKKEKLDQLFQQIPPSECQEMRQVVLNHIRDALLLSETEFISDIVINQGKYKISDKKIKILLTKSAQDLYISPDSLCDYFYENQYFSSSISLIVYIIFLPCFLIAILIVGFYHIIRFMVTWKWSMNSNHDDKPKKSITALQLADMIIYFKLSKQLKN